MARPVEEVRPEEFPGGLEGPLVSLENWDIQPGTATQLPAQGAAAGAWFAHHFWN